MEPRSGHFSEKGLTKHDVLANEGTSVPAFTLVMPNKVSDREEVLLSMKGPRFSHVLSCVESLRG